MFKYIPGNHRFIISLNGEIRTEFGTRAELKRSGNLIEIELYGRSEILDVYWLALIAHFEIYLPTSFKNVTFYDTNPKAFASNSGKIARIATPVMIDRKYRLILNYPHYAVSRNGEVISVKTKQMIADVRGGGQYPTVQIFDPDQNKFRRVLTHRLVAMAWCKNDDYVEKPIVNHIDGNKLNPHHKNLEWCSYKENARHAVDTGLTKFGQEDKLKVLDRETGAVKNYASIRQLAREIGLAEQDRWKIRQYKTQPTVLLDRYEIKTINDDSSWATKTDNNLRKNKHTVIVTFPDGRKETFDDNLSLMRRFKVWNISYNVHEIARVMRIRYPDHRIEVVENYMLGSVQALNILTGKVLETSTIREMSLLTTTAFSSIQKALSSNDLYVHNGHIFRYKTDNPWPDKFRRNPNAPKPILARNTVTGEEVIFPTLKAAQSGLSVSRLIIHSRLESKESIGDWKISEII